jgi:hypothetical protein
MFYIILYIVTFSIAAQFSKNHDAKINKFMI